MAFAITPWKVNVPFIHVHTCAWGTLMALKCSFDQQNAWQAANATFFLSKIQYLSSFPLPPITNILWSQAHAQCLYLASFMLAMLVHSLLSTFILSTVLVGVVCLPAAGDSFPPEKKNWT